MNPSAQALARLVKLQQKAKRKEAGEVVSDDSEEVRGAEAAHS